ncbi:uncharacterized protein NESG_01883 [Nematocida ausubeli]|uniref:Uncharacterized protein n=1 Tax=Nematocida ausubeli (strain ATCC PRA-371 / ERTm2) TaxID=1913371 RepID=A0A086J177_NEMA1|nr:uncharacterized protein NESG_01883 [Nematocida ausubeli]KAI5137638.1 hypothetical protein NEAUS07_2077 [Nematocida ausubeli]KAI5150227.1 hypothetical protein NEAUS05_2088 [Nematocida ausubeli]KFG25895.1 hypothetical protein NESG_01883 [Nematocida ausubeli]
MVRFVVFLALCILSVRCIDIENLDREYYTIQNKTNVMPGMPTQPGAPSFLNMNIEFVENEVRTELNKAIPLIDKIDKLLGLAWKELVHSDRNNKIILIPFKSIKLQNDDGEVSVGYYSRSYVKKDRIIQEYTGGDVCDICKSKSWKGSVHYMADSEELELSGPVETSTCSYKFLVRGNALATKEKYVVLSAVPRAQSEKKEENSDEEKKEEKSVEEKIENTCSRKGCNSAKFSVGHVESSENTKESNEGMGTEQHNEEEAEKPTNGQYTVKEDL